MRFNIPYQNTGNFLINVFQLLASTVIVVKLGQILGPQQYGLYSIAIAIITIISLPINAALPVLIIKEASSALSQNDIEKTNNIFRWSVHRILKYSFFSIIVGCFFLFIFIDYFDIVFLEALIISSLLLPLSSLNRCIGAFIRSHGQITLGLLNDDFKSQLLFAFLIIFISFDEKYILYNAKQALILNVFTALISFFIGLIFLMKFIDLASIFSKVNNQINKIDFNLRLKKFTLFQSFFIINAQLDILILGLFSPSEIVGNYKIALQIASLTSFGITAITKIVIPRFSKLYAQSRMSDLQDLAIDSSRLSSLVGILTILFIIISAQSIIDNVFGQEYLFVLSPLFVLLIGQFSNIIFGLQSALLNLTGNEDASIRTFYISTFINLIFNLMLVPNYGAIGAAASTSFSLVLRNLLLWKEVNTRLGINSSYVLDWIIFK